MKKNISIARNKQTINQVKGVILTGTGRFPLRKYGNYATLRAENKDNVIYAYLTMRY